MHFNPRTCRPSPSRSFSFLTSFPPETRNQIYEYAFANVEHAILVTHRSASRSDGIPMNASPRIGSYDFVFRSISSVQLLRCCRQIYQEGMGVILKGTTVVFTNQRNRYSLRIAEHLSFISSWLENIGHDASVLHRVVIDLSDNGFLTRDSPTHVDILPLLNAAIAPSCQTLWVEFKRNDILAEAMATISGRDALDLERFGDLDRRFSRLILNKIGTEGKITWRCITGYPRPKVGFEVLAEGRVLRKSQILSKGHLLALPHDVLSIICERTLQMPQDIVIDLSLETSTVPDFSLLKVARRHPRLIGAVVPSIYLSNTFRFIMRCRIKRTTSKCIVGLPCWLRKDAPGVLKTEKIPSGAFRQVKKEASSKTGKRIGRAVTSGLKRTSTAKSENETKVRTGRWNASEEPRQRDEAHAEKAVQTTATKDARTILRWMEAVHLEFRFELRKRTSLESLRISIVDVLQTTTWDEPFTATIKCVLTCLRKGGRSAHYESTFTLRHVQLNAFIILSHVLEAQPGRLRAACPKVYINGFGTAVEITYPNKPRGPKFHRAIHDMSNPSKAEERGKYYARWLKRLVPVDEGGEGFEMTYDELRRPDSLIRVWDDLRIALWGEGLRAAW